ncbi:MAG: nucleoside diphosphate kinase regulator, partial [Gammaproteobacteria bacterium]
MSTKPSLILTRLDVQRLERLIDSLDENTPGVEALMAEMGWLLAHAGAIAVHAPAHLRTAMLA